MPRITHTANAERAPARLVSTPHGASYMSSTTRTVVGVVFSDQLAAVVDHAAAQEGWRVEADTRAKRGTNAVVIYPADKDQGPINVSERGAKFNKPHYENLRRQLAHAGLPPLPAETKAVIDAHSLEEAQTQLPPGSRAVNLRELLLDLANDDENDFITSSMDPEILPRMMGTLAHGMLTRFGVHDAIALDAGGAITFAVKTAITAHQLQSIDIDAVVAAAVKAKEGEVNDALAMAQAERDKYDRANRATLKAEEKEAQARRDCAAALADARAQKARADELEAALAPLRNLLGKTGA